MAWSDYYGKVQYGKKGNVSGFHAAGDVWESLKSFDFGDPLAFDPTGFDPRGFVSPSKDYRGTFDKHYNPTAEQVRKTYGYDPTDYSEAGYKKTSEAFAKASGDVFLKKQDPLSIINRALVWQDYAAASKQFYNAQSAATNASIQTKQLQSQALYKAKQAQDQFFTAPGGEADVLLGSNINRRTARRTTGSTPAATARSKVVVRSGGVSI